MSKTTTCRTQGCPGDPYDKEGWDGYCAKCASSISIVEREDRMAVRSGLSTKPARGEKKTARSTKKTARFLVVSYDDDQQQWFHDFVLAGSAKEAQAFVERFRTYVVAAEATIEKDIMAMVRTLHNCSDRVIRKGMETVRAESGCRTPGCMEELNNGEGWNGYCGDCADRIENKKEKAGGGDA